MQVTVNYLAILIAALSSMVVGYLWYGPLFGKKWIQYMGLTQESMGYAKKGMAKTYILGYVSSAVMAYVLVNFVKVFCLTGPASAFQLSIGIWLGFFVTTSLGSVLWEKKSWNLYFLNVVYQLINVFVMTWVLISVS